MKMTANEIGSGTVNLSYIPDESGTFRKYYKINDHLGSVRAIMRQDGFITCTTDYKPFGEKLSSTGNDRLSFINKEKDAESSLGDFGVRKYDEEIGRFTSIDPLFEKYYSLTPYKYSANNPVNLLDKNGKEIIMDNINSDQYLYYKQIDKRINDWAQKSGFIKDIKSNVDKVGIGAKIVYLSSLSDDRPMEGYIESQAGNGNLVEKWNKHWNSEGITVNKKNSLNYDVVLKNGCFKDDFDDFSNTNIDMIDVNAVKALDEFNHVATTIDDQLIEHQIFYSNMYDLMTSGTIQFSDQAQQTITSKNNEYNFVGPKKPQ